MTEIGSVPHPYYAREAPLTGVVLLPRQERHDPGEHPENVRRFPGVVEHLRAAPEWDSLFVLYPRYARIEDALRSHDSGFVEVLQAAGADAPVWLDTDTRVSPESFRHCLLATGGVLSAVDAVAMEAYHRPDSLFALTRPPGHHTGPDRAMGFCLLNHVSIAARYAQATYGFERVAILDWDVHHGNGTQDIHWEDPSTLFVSLHQWPLYPGTGWLDEVGAGDGLGRTVNLPLPPGSGDREHLEALDRVALPVIEAFAPQLLIVSAGQDGHAADTLSSQLVSAAGFRALAERAAALAKRLGIGLVLVHEGGYNVSTLPALDRAILAGLGGFDVDCEDLFVPADAPAPDGWEERMRAILDVQRRHWPELR
jgi:acetoin utilization deacetylase AcuC-like enzyme